MYCFAKICRLCMSQDDTLIHCKARDKNNIPNYHKIRVLFPQLVNKTSKHFPIWICIECQEQVNESYEFKQKCYKTYRLLKKYTNQLHKANRGIKIPDVPSEIFQEIKSESYKPGIVPDKEKNIDSYYNADNITIVKNELLPNNLKNEPECHNMIQAIINNNIEAVRKIDGDDCSAADLKCETIMRNIKTVPEPELEEEHKSELEREPEPELEAPKPEETPDVNTLENSTNDTTEQNETKNQLTAFTLDYTNSSFEPFLSHVGPKITTTEGTNVMEIAQQITGCKRVLRQRKSICYRAMEKGLDVLDSVPTIKRKRSLNERKVPNTSTKQIQPIDNYPGPPKTNPKLRIKNKRATEISDVVIKRTKNGIYFCDRCAKEYKRLLAFKAHVVKCTGYDRHRCSECGKDFASGGNLKRHKVTSHVMLKFKLKCTYCPNEYVSTTYMRKHMQMRHNLFVDKRHPIFY